jgi:hypothetical protein
MQSTTTCITDEEYIKNDSRKITITTRRICRTIERGG